MLNACIDRGLEFRYVARTVTDMINDNNRRFPIITNLSISTMVRTKRSLVSVSFCTGSDADAMVRDRTYNPRRKQSG
jgi:hypothetical protein